MSSEIFSIKKENGMWCVKLVSNFLTVFKSASKRTCQEWRDINQPLPVCEQLNATAGAKVWSARP